MEEAVREYNLRRKYQRRVPTDHRNGWTKGFYTYRRLHFVDEPTLPCCEKIKQDFTSQLVHHRTAVHVAAMFGVSRKELLVEAKVVRAMEALEGL